MSVPSVAVLGASGFVGMHVSRALAERGVTVTDVRAPRLITSARDRPGLVAELSRADVAQEVADLRARVAGCDAVIVAAGVAAATVDGDELFGANALLPGVVAEAASPATRIVHVSSAAVQGRRARLDESEEYAAFSPYSHSKALGEQLLLTLRRDACCFRPTSVQGPGRRVTKRLVALVSSPLASVAGRGEAPTPQALVGNVADAAAFLALTDMAPPRVVLHPWEGVTTGGLVRALGLREPWHVPVPLARLIVWSAFAVGRRSARAAGEARRLEMLWFGQAQQPGWLEGRWSAPQSLDAWKELR